jgi:branched-chain amino acid aminotransferase
MATDPSAGVAYIDGEFIPIGEASVPILDLGFLRSDATYDVVAVWKGKFFRLDKHLDRFFAGLEKLRLELPVDRDGLTRVLADCVRRAGIDDAYVEVIATRGMPVAGSRDIRLCVNRMYCFAIPYVWIATPEQRERGIRLVVGRTERISNKSVDPRIKNYHWLDFEQALLSAYDARTARASSRRARASTSSSSATACSRPRPRTCSRASRGTRCSTSRASWASRPRSAK